MCGIAAVFRPGGRVAKETLLQATAALRHRGPDGQGYWLSPNGEAGLAHARLAVIDLETGDQPLASEDASQQLVVNGEFYGYQAIRNQLLQAGHRLTTTTDSEIALHLHQDLGLGFLDRLRGEFALVLWDQVQRRLVAARDRFGIKPLYYATVGGGLYLASEVKALRAMGVPMAWDQEAVRQLLMLGILAPSRSLFMDVFQIPPGHCLVADRSGLRLQRYWDLPFPGRGEAPPAESDDDLIQGYRLALEEAVSLRLRADVAVGCHLSGGLDSSSVLGFASRHARAPLDAFTVGFEHAAYDESRVAEQTARLCGAVWHPLRITYQDMADHFADAVWHAEGVLSNGNTVAKFLLSRAVRDAGVKVVLTGEGADETLAGYSMFQRDIAPSPGEAAGLSPPIDFTPFWLQAQIKSAERHASLFSPSFLGGLAARDGWGEVLKGLDPAGAFRDWTPLSQSLYLWAKTVLPNYILAVAGDRMEMAHAVEGRTPFLDHVLVERAARLPARLLFAAGTEKFVLREAARSVLTDTVYRRRKQPFFAPAACLDPQGALFACLCDVLAGPGLDSLPFFQPASVRAEVRDLATKPPAARLTLDSVLMKVASLVLLGQHFGL